MKWFGALLIIITSTWAGLNLSKRYRERTMQLRQLKVALQILEAEIVYGLTPLSEASNKISEMTSYPLSKFFLRFSENLSMGNRSVSEAWNEALREMISELSLNENDIEILTQFGGTLGQHDREHQQKQIRLTILHLEREELDAKDAQVRYEKMMRNLGLLGGLLIVILLI
jgi:stage III sporulation protein AB